jgi:catechol 2,3-dioxygenase-like lactoylglutathione lyase family enzyme
MRASADRVATRAASARRSASVFVVCRPVTSCHGAGGEVHARFDLKIAGLGWLGVRTANAAAMCDLYRDVLGLEVIREQPGATWFRLADGTEVHVYGSADTEHEYFGTAPVIGLRVDSFREVRERMLSQGIQFLYLEPQRQDGLAWQHFRGPDGNIYEIIGPDDLDSR